MHMRWPLCKVTCYVLQSIFSLHSCSMCSPLYIVSVIFIISIDLMFCMLWHFLPLKLNLMWRILMWTGLKINILSCEPCRPTFSLHVLMMKMKMVNRTSTCSYFLFVTPPSKRTESFNTLTFKQHVYWNKIWLLAVKNTTKKKKHCTYFSPREDEKGRAGVWWSRCVRRLWAREVLTGEILTQQER